MKMLTPIKTTIFLLLFLTISAGYGQEASHDGLVQAGTGKRTKFPIGTVYLATLHVPQDLKGKDGKEIVDADVPMSVVLQVDTRMLTRERFVDAIREGFQKAKNSGFATDKVETFLNFFSKVEIHKGDIVYLDYSPATGLAVAMKTSDKEKQELGTVAGLPFKKALYAIWLGPDPVQEGLKKGMLGQK